MIWYILKCNHLQGYDSLVARGSVTLNKIWSIWFFWCAFLTILSPFFLLTSAFFQSCLRTPPFQSIKLPLSSHLLAKHPGSWLWLKLHVLNNSLFIAFLSLKSSFCQTMGTSRKMNSNTPGHSTLLKRWSTSFFFFLIARWLIWVYSKGRFSYWLTFQFSVCCYGSMQTDFYFWGVETDKPGRLRLQRHWQTMKSSVWSTMRI